ncbi:MAG: hypothetical protein WA322_05280, partial [Pseudolabrys sp.]
ISQILVETLDEMDLKIPKPSVDLKAIRLQYHSAKIEQEKNQRARCSSRRTDEAVTYADTCVYRKPHPH